MGTIPPVDTLARDLMDQLELDRRLRAVEQAVAGQDSTLKAMLADNAAERSEQRDTIRDMEARLMAAVEGVRPKIWPAVSALTTVLALILVIAQSLYTR